MVQNKTFSAKALQTFVAVMFAVITCFGFMTTPNAEAASGFYVSGTSIYDANGNKFKVHKNKRTGSKEHHQLVQIKQADMHSRST